MTDLRNEARETERTMQSAPQDLLDKVSFGISIMQSKEIRQKSLRQRPEAVQTIA